MPVKLMIEGAVDSELDVLLKRFGPYEDCDIGGWTAHICGDIAILKTGVGAANAAASTALACARLKPIAVLSQGTAGAHALDMHTGDIVIGAHIVRLGAYISPVSERGIDPRAWSALSEQGDAGACEATSDAKLVALALNAARNQGYGAPGRPRIVAGTIGSGDVWNREFDMIAHINERYGTLCEEMETIAAAKVCARMGVPFLSMRVISNNERIGETYAPESARGLQELVAEVARGIVGEA